MKTLEDITETSDWTEGKDGPTNQLPPALARLPIIRFLPPELRSMVVESFTRASYSFGNNIVQEGDDADGFYVIASGKARVIKRGQSGEELPLNVLRAGDSFGEMALLDHGKRTATVRASGDVEVLKLDGSVFQALLRVRPELRTYLEIQTRNRNLQNFFRVYTPFARLPVEALTALLAELETVPVKRGDMIIREGDDPGPMYLIEEGRFRAFKTEDGERRYLAYLRKGDFFGEVALFTGHKRKGSVEAVSDGSLLRLNRETFDRLIENHSHFKAQIEERISQYDYKRVAQVPLDFADEMLPADSTVHQKIGPRQVDQVERSESTKTAGPFSSAEGYFVKRAKRIRRFPFVRQIDETDCGAASLAMVCRFFGRSVSLAHIRQVVHTSTDGTSLRAICSGAKTLGLAARAVKASKSNLAQMPLPAIVHWDGNHWLVLYDVDKKAVRIADPAIGLRRISRDEFESKWSGYAALFDYTDAFENAPESKPSVRWLLQFLQPFAGVLVKAFTLAIIVSALQMLLPVFTQVVVDKVLVEEDTGMLNVMIFSMLAVVVFMVVSMFVQRYLLSFVAVHVDSVTLDFLARKLLALPLNYFANRKTGDIQRRLGGIRQVREFFVQNGVNGLTAMTQIAGSVILMFAYSPLLASVFLALAPLYAGLMIYSSKRLKPIFDQLEEAYGKYHSQQIDAIKGIETVKAMGAEGALRERMLEQFHGLARRQFKSNFMMMTYDGMIQTVSFLSLALFLFVAAHQVLNRSLTVGALLAFNFLVAFANSAIVVLLSMWDNLQVSSVLLNRLQDIFEQEPEQGADHSQLKPVSSLEGWIRFQNLGFQYGGPESPKILEDISFDVPPGKTVAIVGRSGSGKTTLLKCLAGLLEPTDGTILYDGIDMKKLNYHDLRRKIGFVLQENYLFDDTIAGNIAFGEQEPDWDRVMFAARAANAHEFIARLPLGYETKIGESGLALSGGQRQRVAIARAVYHRPPVLIFDEATSALDTESEKAVKENMDKLLEGRTAFVIAHRLSTIRDADTIMVLEKGKLVEHGTHDELMKRRGLYYYLSSQQLEL